MIDDLYVSIRDCDVTIDDYVVWASKKYGPRIGRIYKISQIKNRLSSTVSIGVEYQTKYGKERTVLYDLSKVRSLVYLNKEVNG